MAKDGRHIRNRSEADPTSRRLPLERDVIRGGCRRTAMTSNDERWGIAPSLAFGLGTIRRSR